jgi:hypothetical protein
VPDVVTFDPTTQRIIPIDPGGGVDISLDVAEIYSEWKVWAKATDDFKSPPAFRDTGGDPTKPGQFKAGSFFLLNGWRIRPNERDHRLTLVGDLYTDPAGNSPIVPTLGGYTIAVEYETSSTATLIEGSGGGATAEEVADAVWDEVDSGHTTPGTFGHMVGQRLPLMNGVHADAVNGSDSNTGAFDDPVQTLAQAITVAAAGGTTRIHLAAGTYTHSGTITGYEVMGAGIGVTIITGGYNITSLDGSSFDRLSLVMSGMDSAGSSIDAVDCYLDGGTWYLSGSMSRCRIDGLLRLRGILHMQHCSGNLSIYGDGETLYCSHWGGFDTGLGGLRFQQPTSYAYLAVHSVGGRIYINDDTSDIILSGVAEVRRAVINEFLVDRTVGNDTLTEGIWVNSQTGSDDDLVADGTSVRPYASVSKGITEAVARNFLKVYVAGSPPLDTPCQTNGTIGDPTTPPLLFVGHHGNARIVPTANVRECELRNLIVRMSSFRADVEDSKFYDCTIEHSNGLSYFDPNGSTFDEVASDFYRCRFTGQTWELRQGISAGERNASKFVDCGAADSSLTLAEGIVAAPLCFNFNGGQWVNPTWERWSGEMYLSNMTDVTATADISLAGGVVNILSSCADGVITVRGSGKVNDDSGAGCTVIDETDSSYLSFQDGSAWCNLDDGSAGGEGTETDPVSTLDLAIGVARANKLRKVTVVGAGLTTPTVSMADLEIYGIGGGPTMDLGGVACTNTKIHDMIVYGAQGTGVIQFFDCLLTSITGGAFNGTRCLLFYGITFLPLNDGSYSLIDCDSAGVEEVGSQVVLSLPGDPGVGGLAIRRLSGAVTLKDIDNSETVVEADGSGGHVTIDVSCSNGTLRIRGDMTYTDNSSGAVTIDDQRTWRGDFDSTNVQIDRVLGLLHENSIVDNQAYDADDRLTSARLRVFDSAGNVPSSPGGSETTGLLFEYAVAAGYTVQGLLQEYKMEKVL